VGEDVERIGIDTAVGHSDEPHVGSVGRCESTGGNARNRSAGVAEERNLGGLSGKAGGAKLLSSADAVERHASLEA